MEYIRVDVDKELVQAVKRLTGSKTNREVVHDALRKTLAMARQGELLKRMETRVFSDEQLTPTTTQYPL